MFDVVSQCSLFERVIVRQPNLLAEVRAASGSGGITRRRPKYPRDGASKVERQPNCVENTQIFSAFDPWSDLFPRQSKLIYFPKQLKRSPALSEREKQENFVPIDLRNCHLEIVSQSMYMRVRTVAVQA